MYFIRVWHCLVSLKQPSETEIHNYSGNSICVLLKNTMGSPVLIVSIYMGKFHQTTKV